MSLFVTKLVGVLKSVTSVSFLLLGVLGACTTTAPVEIPSFEQIINTWLECRECEHGELDAVVRLGPWVVRPLKSVLQSNRYSSIQRSRAAIAIERTGGVQATLALTEALEASLPHDVRASVLGSLLRLDDEMLIVLVGDSVASGEGNPHQPTVTGWTYREVWDQLKQEYKVIRSPVVDSPKWQDEECHRSDKSGHALVAPELEATEPGRQVRLINLACSGATINNTIAQLDQAASLAAGQEIDILLISVGGNDIGFGPIVTTCAALEKCFVRSTSSAYPSEMNDAIRAVRDVDQRLAELPAKFDLLADRIEGLAPKSVYITEYFDPTHALPADALSSRHLGPFDEAGDADSTYCHQMRRAENLAVEGSGIWGGWIQLVEFLNWIGVGSVDFNGITWEESKWAFESVVRPLNKEVARAADRHGWNYIGGIMARYYYHGSCATDHWIVRGNESLDTQGDVLGTMHPNEKGHQIYKERLVKFIREGGQSFAVEPTWNARGPIYLSHQQDDSYSGSCVFDASDLNTAVACVPEVFLTVVVRDPNEIGSASIQIDGVSPTNRRLGDRFSPTGGPHDLNGDYDCTSIEVTEQIVVQEEGRTYMGTLVVGSNVVNDGIVCNLSYSDPSEVTWFIKITADGTYRFDFTTTDPYGISQTSNSYEVVVELEEPSLNIPGPYLTGVVLGTETSQYDAEICPYPIHFSGSISTGSPGLVSYRFVRSDGTTEPVKTLIFDGPGTRNVSTTWRAGHSSNGTTETFSGWVLLEVLEPTWLESDHANFALTCGPSPTAEVPYDAGVNPCTAGQDFCPQRK